MILKLLFIVIPTEILLVNCRYSFRSLFVCAFTLLVDKFFFNHRFRVFIKYALYPIYVKTSPSLVRKFSFNFYILGYNHMVLKYLSLCIWISFLSTTYKTHLVVKKVLRCSTMHAFLLVSEKDYLV